MVMSQGTYTFLACFAGFWLIWALVVMLCCFCSFLQRRLKRRREERLREQCLRSVEMEPLSCSQPAGFPPAPLPPQLPREPPQFGPQQAASPPLPVQVPHPMPQAAWVSLPDTDAFGKPPCYEDAVLMEDPPPPYSEVLADPRGGTFLKPAPPRGVPPPRRDHRDPAPMCMSETSKPPALNVFPDRAYSSLIRLPSSQRWDSLGHLLSNMDLNHNVTPPGARSLHAARSFHAAAAMATMPREPRTRGDGLGLHGGRDGLQEGSQGGMGGVHRGLQDFPEVHRLRGLQPSCGLPTAFPLLGRSTAV